MKKTFLFFSIIVLLSLSFMSCDKNEITDIYYHGNSELWLKISENSSSQIEELDIKFSAKNIDGILEDHTIKYTRGSGFSIVGEITSPTEMKKNWKKVYQNFTKTDSISVFYGGREYKTRGFAFSEQRCLEIELKVLSVPGGEIDIIEYDIVIIEQYIEVAKNINYEKDYYQYHILRCS